MVNDNNMLSGGSDYAGRRPPSGRPVRLPVHRSQGAQRSSPEAAAADAEPGLAGALPGLSGHVRPGGAPSVPPEKLLRALLLQVLSTIRRERLLMEQLDYNLLFRWFVGLSLDGQVWDIPSFPRIRSVTASPTVLTSQTWGLLPVHNPAPLDPDGLASPGGSGPRSRESSRIA